MNITAEEREKMPIHYGSKERKRAILAQMIQGARKYAADHEFYGIGSDLTTLVERHDI